MQNNWHTRSARCISSEADIVCIIRVDLRRLKFWSEEIYDTHEG